MLIEALDHESKGRLRQALEIAKEIVRLKPGWSHGHYAVGSALCGLGELYESDIALKKSIARNPNLAGVYARHGEVLNRLGHHEQAVVAVDKAVQLAPNEPKVLVVKALVLWLGGQAQAAYDFLDEQIKLGMDDHNLRSIRGAVAGQIGKLDEGIAELEELVSESDKEPNKDLFYRSALLMHLSKLYDKAQRFDDAFRVAEQAGKLRNTGYVPERLTATCQDRIRVWSKEVIEKLPRSRIDSPKPVFIVGMPRSGTSLIEQVIASHPLAYGGGELIETFRASRILSEPTELQPDRMDVVTQLKRASLDRSARKILQGMERTAGKEIQRITDKLPNNYEHIGMLGLLFPGAKVIHSKRNPLDNSVSCFLLDFVGDHNHGYSYNLEHMAHQYQIYEQYMAHWKEVSPIEILDVQYEDLVANPEEGARRIIDFIGLEWDDRCAKSHETKRAVSTLSSDQVRKPMYTSSIGRWKNYEKHIGVLIDALGTDD